ncbi:MAG TPA: radical SAM protein [Thermoanaerobaculia bacterium]|nr:radical SAM protein [Thermoanaerobaculia bacterium]
MSDARQYRGLLAIVPPYTISGPPAGTAYLLGMLKAHGIHDFGFVDLRLGCPDWPSLTYNAIGTQGQHFVFDVPDLPLILHLLKSYPARDVWRDFEQLPWARAYCRERSLEPALLGDSLRRTERWLAGWAAGLEGPAIVGFSTWISNYLTSLMAAAELKRLANPPFVVFGGPQCTDSEIAGDLAVASGLVDAVVVGEGEQTFLELQALVDPKTHTLNGAPPPGTKVWSNGKVQWGGRRTLLRLDDAPLPDFDTMDLDVYSDKARQISYQLSRGCTDKCEFCSEWVFWERFRAASPERTVESLIELQARTGFGHVTFSDSLLNGSGKRLVGFAEQVLAKNLHFSWSGFVRADITKPIAKLLSRAGLRHVFIGVESLSDDTLGSMHKRRAGADNLRAIEAFLGADISVAAGVIAGFPGDTREDFENTTRVLRSIIKKHRSRFQASVEPFVVTPSATIYKKHAEFGLSLVPWRDEIIGMAPAVAEVTRRCMAAVEGEDQAAERKRRFRYARAKLQPTVKVIKACDLPPSDILRTVTLNDEWVLALGYEKATRSAWLLTTEEYGQLSTAPLTPQLVDDRVGRLQIRWRRPLAPGAGARGVTFTHAKRFGLHPGVVARRNDSDQLVVMNLDTEFFYRMDTPAIGLAELLSDDLRSMDEIDEQLHDTVSEWWSKRLLMGVPAQAH